MYIFSFTLETVFYNVNDGDVLLEIDIRGLSLDASSIQAWSVSEDYTTLALVQQSGDVKLVDLQSYCSSQPHVLRRGKQLQQNGGQLLNSSLNTCQYGDIPWREKLLLLHSDNDKTQESVAISAKTFTSEHILMKPKKQTKVTGFQSRTKQCTGNVQVFVQDVPAAESVQGYSVEDLCLAEGVISVVYSYNDVSVLCQMGKTLPGWKCYR